MYTLDAKCDHQECAGERRPAWGLEAAWEDAIVSSRATNDACHGRSGRHLCISTNAAVCCQTVVTDQLVQRYLGPYRTVQPIWGAGDRLPTLPTYVPLSVTSNVPTAVRVLQLP